ncbi:hypothetical protein LN457_06455 [Xanthomonas phaseoli]|uniref:AbiU2 domain-containing protein n=1 Tax=Xanthomonas phaseoli TaxID=1985254 RepID=UPI0003805E95|nr:hypothetical protein [Xanthomonas phaseoli]MCC8532456.1 hypothetical protein [Xanthomonas phaseoli]
METGEKIRKSLHTMLTQAEIDLEMWQAMRKARSDQEVVIMLNRRYGRFYIAAENALFNSLISILYKAFETRKDTVNFEQLLKTLPSDMAPEIKVELDQLSDKIKATWKKIDLARNKIVGHQSLEQSAEEVHRIAGITILELEGFVKDAQHLLYLVAKNFHDTHVIFNLKGTQSFDNLLNDLRANNSFKAMPRRGTA